MSLAGRPQKLVPTRRVTTERWAGAAYNVRLEHNPVGNVTVLELISIGQDGNPEHIVEVLLDDGSRRTLAQALAGGVVLEANGGLAPGI